MIHGHIEAVEIDGVTLSVDSIGSGPPILCLHAAGHDGHDFDALAERLAHAFRFVRLDWPGHGQSSADHMPASAERYAALAEKLIDILRLECPVILGNSVGGAAAIRIATRRPVRALVLCDSGGLVEMTPIVKRFCRFFETFYGAGARGAWWFQTAFAMLYMMVLRGHDARAQRERIVRASRGNAALLREAWASFSRQDADLREMAAGLDVPIWVAWSRSDRLSPLKFSLPAIDRLKNHRLTIFEGGHVPFLEQPHAFARNFNDFLRELTPLQKGTE